MSHLAVTPGHYVALSAIIFAIGAIGAMTRRNSLVVLMCIELMLNASTLAFVAYGRAYGVIGGQIIAFLVMAVAAAEAAVGLAIVLGVFRSRTTVDLDELDLLRDEVTS